MKKNKSLSIVATIVVLTFAGIIGLYIYSTTDGYKAKQLYAALGNDYTVAQCDTLINRFPNTEWAEFAKQKKINLLRQEHEWASITKKPKLEAVKNFKSKYELTTKYAVAVEEMLDSILWEKAKRGKTQKDYEEYLALGKMTRCHNDAFVMLQKMHQLPDVKAFESQFQKSITQFYDALANAKTNEVLELCSDTIYRFLLRHRLTKPQLADYLNNNYTKKIKKRNFSITSDIEFTKGVYTGQEVGYAALFNLEQVMPSGKVRKNKVTMMFNPEGKIVYVVMRRMLDKSM